MIPGIDVTMIVRSPDLPSGTVAVTADILAQLPLDVLRQGAASGKLYIIEEKRECVMLAADLYDKFAVECSREAIHPQRN